MRPKSWPVGFLLLNLLGCQTGEPEIVVTPQGFTGYVLVVFNQPTGRPPRYAGRQRVYEVPASGVLKTQFAPNYGWTGIPQFFQGTRAATRRLPTCLTLAQVPADAVVGLPGASATVKREPTREERLEWREFYVGNHATIVRAQAQAESLNVLRLVN